jgi:MFS family permease
MLFWIALVPAALAVVILAISVKERRPSGSAAPAKPEKPRRFFSIYKELGNEYKNYLKIAGIFSIGYFSFAFLLLKAYDAGFEIKDVTLLYALFNVSFIIISIPVGKIGDKIGRKKIILAEYLLYLLMCTGFIFATSKIAVILLFLLYGIFYAIDEGQTKAYISSITPEGHRAGAIGLYSFITGLIYLPASLITGLLWSLAGPEAAFTFGAAASLIAFALFLFHSSKKSAYN